MMVTGVCDVEGCDGVAVVRFDVLVPFELACSLLSYAGPSYEITWSALSKISDMIPTWCVRSRASD